MSQDPVRLLDDPTAPRALRDDLTTVAKVPTAIDVEAGLRRFREAMSSPPPPDAAPSGPRRLPRTSAKGWAAAALGATLAAGLVAFALRSPSPSSAVGAATSTTVSEPTAPVPVEAASPSPTPSSEIPSIDISALPGVRVPSSVGSPVAPASRTAPSVAQPRADGGPTRLQEEIDHLSNLRAVASRDQNEALRLAEDGNRRFADGMFGQEREAIAIEALVRLGRRDEAKARGAQFLARYPRGPFAERIRRELERVKKM